MNRSNEYNKEPVLYCKHCLSLGILNIEDIEDTDYCDNCGSTDIGTAAIEEWEQLYKNKYGHSYLNYDGEGNKD